MDVFSLKASPVISIVTASDKKNPQITNIPPKKTNKQKAQNKPQA